MQPCWPDSVLYFKKACYPLCHALLPIVSGSGATGGHCQARGWVSRWWAARRWPSLCCQEWAQDPEATSSGASRPWEQGALWIGQGSGSGQRAAQLALKAGEEQLRWPQCCSFCSFDFYFFTPPAVVFKCMLMNSLCEDGYSPMPKSCPPQRSWTVWTSPAGVLVNSLQSPLKLPFFLITDSVWLGFLQSYAFDLLFYWEASLSLMAVYPPNNTNSCFQNRWDFSSIKWIVVLFLVCTFKAK